MTDPLLDGRQQTINAAFFPNNPPFSRRPSKTFSFPLQKVLEGQVEKIFLCRGEIDLTKYAYQ